MALYLVGSLVILDQLTQLVIAILPFHLDQVNWRYAAFGVAIGYLASFLLADLLIIAAASGSGHRRFLRAWGVLHALLGLALLTVLPLYVLDVIVMRAFVRPELEAMVVATSVRHTIVGGLGGVTCFLIAWFLWRGSRTPPRSPAAPLVTIPPADRGALS
jgi:putative flippase GtrA